MSMCERGMKGVLFVVMSVLIKNAPGRYILVRAGMSKHDS